MFTVAHERGCRVIHLPGRDWFYLIGPDNSDSRNLTFGLAEFPVGSQPAAHTHDAQEEIIFILSGRGRFITPGREEVLMPGMAVFIPPGLEHRIAVEGNEPLKLVTVFSPPVVPGAYDPGSN